MLTSFRREAGAAVVETRADLTVLMVDLKNRESSWASDISLSINEWSAGRVKLIQRDKLAEARLLVDNDFTMESDSMTECVTMFVLWDWGRPELLEEDSSSDGDLEMNPDWPDEDPGDYYQKARGFHGGGGVKGINLKSLFAGVPNDSGTKVFVCLGPQADTAAERERIEAAAQKRWNETDWQIRTGREFKVNRWGELSEV